MRVRPLTLRHRNIFTRFLSFRPHELSAYSFENIYIWRSLYRIEWAVHRNALYVFFKDASGCFLYLPPLADRFDPIAVEEAFKVMDAGNGKRRLSRIENIEAQDIGDYRAAGYTCREKFPDYLCNRAAVAGLRGNVFKSQRASRNHFRTHYHFHYTEYQPSFKDACIRLYRRWMHTYKSSNKDPVYQGMLQDSFTALRVLLDDYEVLKPQGRVILVEGEIKGCTFGFKVSNEVFCVLFEFTDLSIKGISQYLFSRFCAELQGYAFINIMDDCGLENLRKVKQSYRPHKIVSSFIATWETH